jgi:uncharacterized protein (DUF1697 family)
MADSMVTYCAFLRGVNVNGRTMRMTDVRESFISVKAQKVVTVQASGNIIFTSTQSDATLKSLLQDVLSERYGFGVDLFVKSREEIATILAAVPFPTSTDRHIYAYICEPGFESDLEREFAKVVPIENEKARSSGGYFFWQVPKGSTLDASFSKTLGRKDLKDRFTSRNISTIAKVLAKME